MTERAPTEQDVRETRNDVVLVRERIVVLEQFRAWHDRDWDQWKAKIEKLEATVTRHDRMLWYALGAGAAGGGAVATVLTKLLGG
jgi:hypothetical protein